MHATTDRLPKSNLPTFLLLGLVQGITCLLATTFWPSGNQWATALTLGSFIGIIVVCLTLQFTGKSRQEKWMLPAAMGMGIIFALPACWCVFQVPPGCQNNWASVLAASAIFSGLILFYILLPFVQAWPHRQNGRYKYTDLYRHSWDNFFIILVATILAAAYWLLIVLWVMLFKMVGITVFKTIFFSSSFAWLTLPVTFSLGIHIGLTHDRIIGTLRQITLSLCSVLMPLLSVITILFAVSLPFTGLQPIWDTGHSTPILLCLLGINIVFLNGIFQDGNQNISYSPLLLKLIEGAILLLPVFALIGVYSTALRINQYGLTPKRIYLSLMLVVACCYSFSYAFAVIKKSQVWMGSIRSANTLIALMISGFIILLHSPVLNPVAISANNQFNRLLTKKIQPDKFDFGALKFQLGIPGEKYLKQLNSLPQDDPFRQYIQLQLDQVNRAEGYYAWENNRKKNKKNPSPHFTLLGQTTTSLEGLSSLLEGDQCTAEYPCFLYPIDLNNDAVEELILIHSTPYYQQLTLFGRSSDNHWEKQGTLGDEMSEQESKTVVKYLKQSPPMPVPARYQSITIGETVYHFQDLHFTKKHHTVNNGSNHVAKPDN